MSASPAYFEPIRQRAAQRWDQLEGDPELAGPWHLLFKQIQRPRHILSELLQNADDAGATEASVRIEEGAFIFKHNGKILRRSILRPFADLDIRINVLYTQSGSEASVSNARLVWAGVSSFLRRRSPWLLIKTASRNRTGETIVWDSMASRKFVLP